MKSKLFLSILFASAIALLTLSAHAETEGKIKGKVVTSGDKGMLMPTGGAGTASAKTAKDGSVSNQPAAKSPAKK